ncbi:MAG: hypothetical protein WDZ52_13105, partial [Pseudohongiellaceae bacterium]
TPGFHPGNRGSKPLGDAIYKSPAKAGLFYFCVIGFQLFRCGQGSDVGSRTLRRSVANSCDNRHTPAGIAVCQ